MCFLESLGGVVVVIPLVFPFLFLINITPQRRSWVFLGERIFVVIGFWVS
jgi:hypothetical protein